MGAQRVFVRADRESARTDCLLCLGGQVEPVCVHNLGPGIGEVPCELLAVVIFRVGAQDRVGAEDEVGPCRRPFDFAPLAVADFVLAVLGRMQAVGHIRQVYEEIVGERAFTIREDAVLGAAVIDAKHPHAANQNSHLAGRESHQLRAIKHHFFSAHDIFRLLPVPETIGKRFQHLKRVGVGLCLDCRRRAGGRYPTARRRAGTPPRPDLTPKDIGIA